MKTCQSCFRHEGLYNLFNEPLAVEPVRLLLWPYTCSKLPLLLERAGCVAEIWGMARLLLGSVDIFLPSSLWQVYSISNCSDWNDKGRRDARSDWVKEAEDDGKTTTKRKEAQRHWGLYCYCGGANGPVASENWWELKKLETFSFDISSSTLIIRSTITAQHELGILARLINPAWYISLYGFMCLSGLLYVPWFSLEKVLQASLKRRHCQGYYILILVPCNSLHFFRLLKIL